MQVGAPALAAEAPHTPSTTYLQVPFTATVRHALAPTGQPHPQSWLLRLVTTPETGWRVDGVLTGR